MEEICFTHLPKHHMFKIYLYKMNGPELNVFIKQIIIHSFIPSIFSNFICIYPQALVNGAEEEGLRGGDALCGAAEGGAPVLMTSAPCGPLIGPRWAPGVRRDHDE